MTETSDIIAILRTALPDLRRQWPIRSLALFGSRVRNDATPDSDLDVLVEFTRPIALSSFLALEDRLAASQGCGSISCRRRHSSPISASACEPRQSLCDGRA
jgi:predicted nucleotidyltransferase